MAAQQVAFAGMRTNVFRLAAQRKVELLAEPAHPADLAAGHAHDQRKGHYVGIADRAGADEGVLAYGDAAEDRAVGAEGCAALDERSAVLILARECRRGVVDVGEHHAGPTDHVVLERDLVIDRHAVLDLDVVADYYAVADEHVLAEDAVAPDPGPGTDVDPVPHARALSEFGSRIHHGGGMDLGLRH